MSKSKRAAQTPAVPAPRKKRNIFLAGDGGLRTGWLLAVSLFAYAAVAAGLRFGLARAFAALFDAWGIDASNAHLAPVWARVIYVWHGSFVTVIVAGLTLALFHILRRLWKLRKNPNEGLTALPKAALAGTVIALAVAALCVLPDSDRLAWPLSAPRLSASLLPLCVVAFIGILAEEAFLKGVLYDGLKGRWGAARATGIVTATFFVIGAGWAAGVVGGINVILLGLVCCLLHCRYSLWAPVGFRWAWSVVNMFLLGFGGGDSAVYRLYGVSETLLTGGDAGPVYGLWTTLLLAGIAAGMIVRHKRTAYTKDCFASQSFVEKDPSLRSG